MSPLLTELPRMAAALIVVLGCVWLAARIARMRQWARSRPHAEQISVQSHATIDPRRRAIVIRWNGQAFLVMTGPAGDILLGSHPVTRDGVEA